MSSAAASEPITFAAAIARTQTLLAAAAQDDGSVDLAATVATLVATVEGARGFFVAFLTGESPLADRPPAPLVDALTRSPDIVADLLVKNLAMSTAMAIAHRRNGDETMAQGSDRVQTRTRQLLTQLPRELWQAQAIALHASATQGASTYDDFLDRWGYDTAQRQAIAAHVQALLSGSPATL